MSGSPVFQFDAVFPDSARTPELYTTAVSGIVRSAFEGVSGTVMAYG